MAGYELMIADEVFRGRYYKGFDKPQPLVPNAATHYTIGFPGNDHTFLKGHRMMVQVQSTWFPLIDRNPQKFVENIFTANESDFQKATQRIYLSGANASYLDVPIAEGSR
jgi:predicted acyl esterase